MDNQKNEYLKQLDAINIALKELSDKGYESNKKKTQLLYDIEKSKNDGNKVRVEELQHELDEVVKLIADIIEKRKIFWQQKLLIDKELRFLNPPEAQNEIIDLRLMHMGRYGIYLHGEKTLVGTIDYRGNQGITLQGDVGYSVGPEFRGHNYAYEALCLLSGILCNQGISEFLITVNSANIASLKTIEKYGGELIKEADNVLFYRCLTRTINKGRD